MTREGEVRPETGDRCGRCHRTAPRSDGIRCGLCSPYGPTTVDEDGVTHDWDHPCLAVQVAWHKPNDLCRLDPVVSDRPVDCMACVVGAARAS